MVLHGVAPCAESYDIWSYGCPRCGGTFDMVEARTGEPAPFADKRAVRRHGVTITGTIEFSGGGAICMVSNLSASGAGLDLAGRIELPERFTLIAHGARLPCQVIWRRDNRIGIAFD